MRKKEEEVRKLLEAQKTASEENKKEITKMIQTYSSQIDQLNKGHIDAINQMREANERQNQKMREDQEKFLVDQEKKRVGFSLSISAHPRMQELIKADQNKSSS
jgi:hypothetical protein